MRREERVLQPADRVWAPAQAGGTRTVAPRSAASPSPRPPRCWSGTRRRRCLPPDLSPPLSAGLAAFPRPLTALSMPFLGLSLLFLHLSLPFIAFHCLCLTSHWLSTAYPGLAFRFTRLPRRSLLNINAFRSIKELLPRLVATLRVARLSSQLFRNQHTDTAFCQPQTKLQTGTTRTVT